MYKAGGVIGLIAGVFGFIAAIVTLFLGGVGAAFGAKEADGILGFGLGGIVFSFSTIVFAAMVFSKPKGAGIGLMVCAILGALFGGTFVAVCMVLAAIGGLLAVLDGSVAKQKSQPLTTENVVTESNNIPLTTPLPHQVNAATTGNMTTAPTLSNQWILPALIGVLVMLSIAVTVTAYNKGNAETTTHKTKSSSTDTAIIETSQTPLDELANKVPDSTDANILSKCFQLLSIGSLADKKKCSDTLDNGKIVQWHLNVFGVEQDKNGYLAHARSEFFPAPITIYVTPRNDADKTLLESLTIPNSIAVKGVLEINDDNIVIKPAILVPKPVKPSSQPVIEPVTNTQQSNATDTQPVAETNTEKAVGKGRSAFVYKPPSNVRNSPNGDVLCSIDEPTNITVYDYAGSTYNGTREVKWYYTDACGSMGVIAYSQFR